MRQRVINVAGKKELADRIMMGHSERIKKLFSMVADEDEAKLLVAMPASPEDLAEATGRPVDEVAILPARVA